MLEKAIGVTGNMFGKGKVKFHKGARRAGWYE